MGGSILVVQNKPFVITLDQQSKLDKELGEKRRNQLYTEIVLENSASLLRAKYVKSTRPVTAQLIEKYQHALQNNTKSVPKVGSL